MFTAVCKASFSVSVVQIVFPHGSQTGPSEADRASHKALLIFIQTSTMRWDILRHLSQHDRHDDRALRTKRGLPVIRDPVWPSGKALGW